MAILNRLRRNFGGRINSRGGSTCPPTHVISKVPHVEAVEAKQILDRLGLRSALMVSSPYHTKRISMICNRVFQGGYGFAVVPSRLQQIYSLRDWFDKDHRKKIVSEYVKIGWFLMYEPLS